MFISPHSIFDTGLIGVKMLKGQMFCLGEAVTQTVSLHDFFLLAFSRPENDFIKVIAICEFCHSTDNLLGVGRSLGREVLKL